MPYDPTSINAIHTDAWKNPESLGFSTWRRHTAISLAEGTPDKSLRRYGHKYDRGGDQGGQGGLRAIYDRHASFASGLIARRHQQNESTADVERFIYTSFGNKLQRFSYPTTQFEPAFLQCKPYHGWAASPATAAARDPADGGAISRMHETRPSHMGASLPSAESANGHTNPGAGPRSFVAADSLNWRRNRTTPSGSHTSSLTSSSLFQLKGEAGLPAGNDGNLERNPVCRASLSINRSLARPSSFYSQTRSGEGIQRAHKRADTIAAGNAEAGSVLNRRLGSSQIHQRCGEQVLPIAPSVSEAATLARTATVSEFRYRGYSGRSETISPKPPNILPGFSLSSGPVSATRPAAQAEAGRVDREEGARDLQKTESAPQVSSGGYFPRVAAGPSGPAISGFSERPNDRFNDPDTHRTHRTHHAGSPGSISYVLRRFTNTSSSKTSSLKAPPLTERYRTASRDSSLTGRRDSIALTSSPQIPVSAHGARKGIQEGIHNMQDLMLRRSIATPHLPASAKDGSDDSFDSPHVVATHALPGPIQRPQSMQPRLMSKHGEHGRGHEGHDDHGDHGDYGGYEAGSLPVVQRLQDKTSLFPGYLRAITPQLAVSSVHSPDAQNIAVLSHLSHRVLQKKPIGLLTAVPGPHNRPGSCLQPSRLSLEGKFDRDGSLPLHGLQRSIARSGASTSSSNHSGTTIAGHSVSAVIADTRSHIHTPTFLPASRQTGITRTAYARSGITGSMDIAPGIRSTVSGSKAIDSIENGSIDSNSSAINSPGNGPVPIAFDLFSRESSVSLRRSRSTTSISAGEIIPAPEARWHDNKSFNTDQAINPAHPGWAPGSGERPLAVPQRAQNKLMRISNQGDATLATIDRAEDRYGLVSPSSEPLRTASTSAGDGNKAPESGPAQPDPDETAEHVWRMMAERLVIEQERRGLAKWP